MSFYKNINKKIYYNLKTFFKKKFFKFYGLKDIDKKMLKYLDFDNGYFIEIGAHDGVNNSNTLHYEKYKKWKGILIEPSFSYAHLKKNRSKINKFFNCGCIEFNGIKETTLLNSGDYSICKNIVNAEYFSWHSNKQFLANKEMIETKIKLRTLNSILIESNSPNLIDFFSLDVEGMEINVLKGVDFKIFNFKYLLIECSNKEKFEEILKFLTLKEYNYIENLSGWDYLFKYKHS